MPAKDYYPDATTKDAIDDEWAEAIFDTYDDGGRHLADMLEKHPVPKQAKEFLINLLRGNYGPLGLAVNYVQPNFKDITSRNFEICMEIMELIEKYKDNKRINKKRIYWQVGKKYKLGEKSLDKIYYALREDCTKAREDKRQQEL